MERPHFILPVFVVLLILGTCIAGCSDSAESGGAAATPEVTAVPTTSGPVYGAGDIVKNPNTDSAAGLLILSYDPATDKYERAYIYPNADGSWGYRMDSRTDTIDRAVIEKVYTTKAGTVTVSAIPIGTSASQASQSSSVISTTSPTETPTATVTTALSPKISMVDPDKGKTGETVAITNIEGQYFVAGANVSLTKSGESPILATDVSVSSNTISCNVLIPADADLGYWDLVVRNPDGQSDDYKNAFLVQQGTVTTTTTTAAADVDSVSIISTSPSVVTTGGNEGYIQVIIVGSNLNTVSRLALVKSGTTIASSSFYPSSSGSAQATFNIPAGSSGIYTVNAYDINDNIVGNMTNGFTIQ